MILYQINSIIEVNVGSGLQGWAMRLGLQDSLLILQMKGIQIDYKYIKEKYY